MERLRSAALPRPQSYLCGWRLRFRGTVREGLSVRHSRIAQSGGAKPKRLRDNLGWPAGNRGSADKGIRHETRSNPTAGVELRRDRPERSLTKIGTHPDAHTDTVHGASGSC